MSLNSVTKFVKNCDAILGIEEDKVFVYCLIVSIGLHAITLLTLYVIKIRLPVKPFKKKIEVVYQAARPVHAEPVRMQEALRIKDKKEISNPQILTKKEVSPQ